MQYVKNRIIHRFIRDITEYLEDGICYGQVLPADTQVYADYSREAGQVDPEGNPKIGLYYVIGDGIHTYLEIRDGAGVNEYNKEYMAFEADSSVLKDVYLSNLKDGHFLRWNSEKDRWINVNAGLISLNALMEENEFDCGLVDNTSEEFIDGGHAGAIQVNYLDSSRLSKTDYNIEFIKWS